MTKKIFKRIDWELILELIQQRENISQGLQKFLIRKNKKDLQEFIKNYNLKNNEGFNSNKPLYYYDEDSKTHKRF